MPTEKRKERSCRLPRRAKKKELAPKGSAQFRGGVEEVSPLKSRGGKGRKFGSSEGEEPSDITSKKKHRKMRNLCLLPDLDKE